MRSGHLSRNALLFLRHLIQRDFHIKLHFDCYLDTSRALLVDMLFRNGIYYSYSFFFLRVLSVIRPVTAQVVMRRYFVHDICLHQTQSLHRVAVGTPQAVSIRFAQKMNERRGMRMAVGPIEKRPINV